MKIFKLMQTHAKTWNSSDSWKELDAIAESVFRILLAFSQSSVKKEWHKAEDILHANDNGRIGTPSANLKTRSMGRASDRKGKWLKSGVRPTPYYRNEVDKCKCASDELVTKVAICGSNEYGRPSKGKIPCSQYCRGRKRAGGKLPINRPHNFCQFSSLSSTL